jgi:hypothetical protein
MYQDAAIATEYILAIQGTRMLNAFGAVPRVSTERTPPEGIDDWRPITRLSQLYWHAERGELWAVRLLLILQGDFDELDNPDPHDP